MIEVIGWSMIGGSVALGLLPDMEKRKVKKEIWKAFDNGGLYKEKDKIKIYPNILRVESNTKRLTVVFSIPKGMNPESVEKALFVFKQHFGKYTVLDVDEKRGVLKIYPKGLPTKYKYDYADIRDFIGKQKLPIVCGQNLDGDIFSFDMVENPHILISGETGSGKSSEIRSILTTLIKTKSPNDLKLVCGDLKRSEFHFLKNIEHVEGVYHSASELRPSLKKISKEMIKRGNKLDEYGVNSIDELKEKLPYIVVCIDEVVLLKKETDIMDALEEISSIGRSLGVFIILSMQRPDSKLLDGKLKVNLTVRMGFKTADSMNAKIIGTPGSEKLKNAGRMLLKVNSNLQEIQCPLLENKKAKELLQPHKVNKKTVKKSEYEKVVDIFNETT